MEDLELKAEYSGLPYDLVIDKEWLKKQVKKFDMKPEEALIVTINGKGEFFCQRKEEK